MATFPERLKAMRERRGQSSEALSQLCSLDKGTIRRYENGERKPSLACFVQIADYFGVSLDYLAGRSDDPTIR